MAAVSVICLLEFFGMLEAGKAPCFRLLGAIGGAGLVGVIYLEDFSALTAYAGALLVVIFTGAVLSAEGDAFSKDSNTIFGAVYIGLTLGALTLVRKASHGDLLVITLITSNALGDVFAYYTGRAIGKTPLAPSISPKKTREGFAGGVIGAIAGAVAIKIGFMPFMSVADSVVLGLISGLVGPMGDLAESSIKRRMGVKDSGKIIPGHGGALDRIDSLMFSSVFFYLYISLALAS